jgi:hypothetical protein
MGTCGQGGRTSSGTEVLGRADRGAAGIGAALDAEGGRAEPVAAAKGLREVRRLTVADDAGDVAHGDRGLLDQKLRRRAHAPRQQILAEGALAELRVGARQLPRRTGERAGDPIERQRAAVVARDRRAGQQVQAAALLERGRTHIPLSDRGAQTGQAQRPNSMRACTTVA